MFATHKKIEGFFIILIILVSFYIGIVQIVNALEPDGILKSLTAKSLRNTNSASQFVVGDVLTVEAEADLASEYDLQIYQNSSLVFERNGQVSDSLVKVRIPLDPPIFNSGSECFAFLYVFISNYPIPGVYFIDHVSWVFKITGTETRLSLNGEYDNVMRNLCLCANLTDINGYPVVNETIHFFLQSVSRRRPTNGWLPIGCAVTNVSGLYASRLAVGVRSGDYLVKACHERNENFGESESIIGIDVSSETGLESPVLYARSDTFVDSGRVFGSNGTVSIEPSSHSPYAVLSMNATGRYTSSTPLGPGIKAMIFYADYTNRSGCIAWGGLSLVDESPSYVYECPLTWTPMITGFHRLIGGVAVGGIADIMRAVINGTGIIASGSVDLDIQRCPSNMTLHFSETVYNDVSPVTAAFSEPRLYEANDDGWFATCSLGPKLEYNNGSYVIDEPVISIPIKLYVNNTFMGINSTNEDGFISVPLHLNFTGIRSQLSINAVVDEPSLLYQGGTIERDATFTKVNIRDVVAKGSDVFRLNYTIKGYSQEKGEIYVGAQNSIEVKTELFGWPVCNAPVFVLVGKPVKRDCTNGSGWVSVPAGSSFLRTARLYNIASTTAYAACDIVLDGKVDIKDLTTLINAFGSYPGMPKWNWRADVNFDVKVDIKDQVLVIKSFGKVISYVDIVDHSVVKAVFFRDGQQYEAWLDFWGCFSVPGDVQRVGFYVGGNPVGAVVEFFRDASHQEGNTNNLGMAETTWVPSETGSATSSYFLLVRLPSSFKVLTAQPTNVTTVDASLSLVSFLSVEKRPIELSVEYTPDDPTLDTIVTMIADVFDLGLGAFAQSLMVKFYAYNFVASNGSYIYMGCSYTNSSGVAVFTWLPRDYLDECGSPEFVLDVMVVETAYTVMDEEVPVYVDTRYPTKCEFLMGGDAINIAVGAQYELDVRLVRADDGSAINGVQMNLYVDDVFKSYSWTNSSGIAYWYPWFEEEEGVYYYSARFVADNLYYQPSNEARLVVVAEVIPMCLVFDVQPHEFKPETPITLTAKVLNATSLLPLEGRSVVFYAVKADGSNFTIGQAGTNSSGVAVLPWLYPSSLGPLAFAAKVAAGQNVMSSPVMLTVAKETVLWLNVSKQLGFKHAISGRLLSYGEPVIGKTVKIYVNDTLEAELTTWEVYGNFSLTLDLPAVDNKPTTYNIQTVFEGDAPSNATAYAYTPNGTEYAVCTTIQYGFKPSSNSTMLTVTPQSTDSATQTKTPEQMQQEAERSGWLSMWHEFSWWYPWYRLHAKININPTIDIGFNPILPGGETANWNGLGFFSSLSGEVLQTIGIEAFGLIATYLAAKYASIGSFVAGIAVESTKIILQSLFLLPSWDSAEAMLASGLMSAIMLVFAITDFGSAVSNFLVKLIDELKWVCGGAVSALTWVLVKLKDMFLWGRGAWTWVVDLMEILADAAFTVIALRRYINLLH